MTRDEPEGAGSDIDRARTELLASPVKVATVNSSLLSRQRIAVATEGELVTLTIGNATIKMPYETALQLSQWLRVRGKQAKRLAGDMSRHWSALAVLDGLKG